MLKEYRLTRETEPLPLRHVQAPARGAAAPFMVLYAGSWRRVYWTAGDWDYFIHKGKQVALWPTYEAEESASGHPES